MSIHTWLRPEKKRWNLIRKNRDFEAIRQGYNELKLTTPTQGVIPDILSIVNRIKDLGVPLNAKILDAGSGSGVVSRHFKEGGFTNITAFDISDENVESTKPYANHVFRSTCEDIQATGESFDVVICNGVIEHCMDIDQSLKEFHRVLRPNGYLYLMTDNAWWQTFIAIKNIFLPKRRRYERYTQPLDGDFTVPEMQNIIEHAQFKVVKFWGYGGIPVANRLVEKVMRDKTAHLPFFSKFTSRMIFIAQKI